MKSKGSYLVLCLFAFLGLVILPVEAIAALDEPAPGSVLAKHATKERESWSTTDHSKHFVLQQEFESGTEVTDTCLSCHTEASAQVKNTIHWTWIDPNSDKDTLVGKAGHSVNNFFISTNRMNDPDCLDCHVSWNGQAQRVNCLVCHGQSDFDLQKAFEKLIPLYDAGDDQSEAQAEIIQKDIQAAIQDISRPTRKNCGSCHFYGDGGDGVKHGDLDSSMAMPDKTLDVHMGRNGQKFQCVRCHTTVRHHVAGRIYATPAVTHRRNLLQDDLTPKIMCESCHGGKPHRPGVKANDHTDKVACQSCHIPQYARIKPTQIWWDWSTAGQKKDGKPFTRQGPFGKPNYASTRGEMRWGKNLTPDYFWFNGAINTLTVKDTLNPDLTNSVSWPEGHHNDDNSRIFPFKVHGGKLPYDKVHKKLLAPLLSGEQGFWNTLDMSDALSKGMAHLKLPFSGQFDFVKTRYVFPITHMVAPKETALDCTQCHTREGSRLKHLTNFYMPGRGTYKIIDWCGWILVSAMLVIITIHAMGRVVSTRRLGD